MSSSEFLDYITSIIEKKINIYSRKLFGGYGIYHNGKIFAIIADNQLYFKAKKNSALEKKFKEINCDQFGYIKNNKLFKMQYFLINDEMLEDDNLLEYFINESLYSS